MRNHPLVERYVYAVTKRIPKKNQEDIAREIETLIEDLMEQYENETVDEQVKKALLELGDPTLLREKYIDQKRFLIGPALFDHYIMTLKVVLIAIFIGITIASFIDIAFSNKGIIDAISSYISNTLSTLLQSFAWVTGIFAIIEYKGVELNGDDNKEWSIKDLPEKPKTEFKISRVQTTFGIIFISIFAIVLYMTPESFAAYFLQSDEGLVRIPLFDLDVIKDYRFLILSVFIVGITKEIIKLISGYWTLTVAISYSILTAISTVLVLIFLTDRSIWNSNFIENLNNYTNFEIEILKSGNQFLFILIVIIIIATMIDIISTLVKGFKYQRSNQELEK